jgi:anti-sigma regulatory factor (Ser/Thr protein kinase)
MNTAENQIIRLTLPAKLDFLPGATALVREVISKLGLEDKDSRKLELVVEEACVNVIQNAFEDDKGNYDIAVLRRPGQIIVAVEDRGLPIDFKRLEEDSESGLGVVLMKAFADEVQFLNLGRQGKRVEIVKNLPEKDLDKYIREAAAAQAASPATISINESDITVRLMRPDETINLARCAYRCYGYTYASDHIYYPERSHEMVASGLMISVVAVNPQGDIIGHLAVVKETPQALTGESGQAIVDPRYRSNGIHKRMGFLLADINKASGMVGTFGEAVTVHPYSQKSALTRGYIETGVLLGFVPTTMYFKQLQSEAAEKRRAVLLMYKRLNEEPLRDVFLPAHHAGMLKRIYENSKLRRNFVSGPLPDLPERSQVNVNVRPELNWAFLRVVEYGRDLEELVKFRVKELCQKRIECIYLELPLSHPAVQHFCAPLEMLGFFFGGISPEMVDGDLLRLQFFNNVDLELKDIQLATDFGREMLQYVLKAGGY